MIRLFAKRALVPGLALIGAIAAWDAVVRIGEIEPFILPGPLAVARSMIADRGLLFDALGTTLLTALEGFVAATVIGVCLAILFDASRVLRQAFLPYAVVLQVTPVVAIAPLLLIYLPQQAAVVACAFIVAFFPVLSNTMFGLASANRNLLGLFRLYGASRWQTLIRLKLPSALPSLLAGLRIAGGLSLIGAVVAEIAAGSAGAGAGLAYRISEAGYRLNIPRMFAGLLLLSAAGIVIYTGLAFVSQLLLRRWHESARERDED